MRSYTIRRLNPRHYPEWNDFVLGRRTGTIFQTARWLVHFPKGHFGVQACFDGDELMGGFAYRWIRTAGMIRILAPPLTPYYGPVWKEGIEPELQMHLTQLVLRALPKYHALQLTPNKANTPLGLPDPESWLIDHHSTYVMEPDFDDDEDLLNYYSRKTRYQVRKSRRDGLKTVHDIPFEEVRYWAERSLNHAGRSFPLPQNPFDRLCSELKETSSVHTLAIRDSDDKTIAAQMLVHDSHTAYNILFGIDREEGHRTAGTLLMHEGILWAMKQGLRYDFEGSSIKGIQRFYEKFDPEKVLVPTYTQVRTARIRWLNTLVQFTGRRLY